MTLNMISLSILVVDDHKLQAKVLKNKLFSLNINNVICVSSGKEALREVKINEFDIIFCDLNMPEMDGVKLLSSLKEYGFDRAIVILSALDKMILSTVGEVCKRMDFSFVEIIEKPAEIKQLNLIVENVRRSRKKDAFYISKQTKVDIDITVDDILLALSKGEFKNYYQPQVDFKSGKTVSVEVLARWLHPIYGLLSPSVFLPILESENLTDELFDVILMNTLDDYNRALKFPSSINVTQDSLNKPCFSERFLNLCSEYKVDPSLFTFELTEKEVMNDSINLLENLSRLRINNVGLSIDDFGTGYSSLIKLSKLPFTEIKVDRSFISNCIKQESDKAIVDFSCALAKEMKLIIVAEGVEDKETLEYLKNLGFDLCQGYYTAKPMPIEAFSIFIEIEGMS